jgi:hypothetical protein
VAQGEGPEFKPSTEKRKCTATQEAETGESWLKASLGTISMGSYLRNKLKQKDEDKRTDQEAKYLLSKRKTLSSSTKAEKNKIKI